jgi:hypothetical protein
MLKIYTSLLKFNDIQLISLELLLHYIFYSNDLLDGRNIDVDMEEAKELQQNIIKKLNEEILIPDNVHDLLDLLEIRRVHGEDWEPPSDE